ncbi:BrnA antitoxin family protein [Novosphingobium resinovorum]|uniref:BrnA antitoxin family protein n=1 Tax=Novosphingobium resinovorum TaxID=158500 RepID=UPI002ED4DF3A|nr:BrnA antitoxin family protein [Novosphingobium resinovorum]
MTIARYTQADMDAVSDNPEWTEEDFAKAVPFAEAFPDLANTIRRRGAQKAPTKVSTTIRLSPEVIAHFRAGGPGWQSRIDEALKDWLAAHGR